MKDKTYNVFNKSKIGSSFGNFSINICEILIHTGLKH